ncbi:MAG: SET domain-containing protein [Xanthobacteraceae bacterium]|nr:SET domain-containing protein [Xanthobacteraceae bacterium]
MPAISSDKPYRIGRARTGLGLFATKPIKKGQKIIRYIGPLLDSKKKKDEAVDNKYLFEINNRWTIDGSPRKNIARYINHSCRPNSESDVSARKKRVVIRATKNIEPGEEINYDYGKDYFKIFLKPIGCKCDHCEKKRKKERADARAEKTLLKLKTEKKAAKSKAATAVKTSVKAKKAAGKPQVKPEAHARGAGKVTKTKASRTQPFAAAGAKKGRAQKKARS